MHKQARHLFKDLLLLVRDVLTSQPVTTWLWVNWSQLKWGFLSRFEYQLFCNEHLEDEVQDYHPSSQQPIDVESSMLRDQFAALWGDDSESDEAVEEWTRLREQECKLLPVVKDEGWGITLPERATVISIMYEVS